MPTSRPKDLNYIYTDYGVGPKKFVPQSKTFLQIDTAAVAGLRTPCRSTTPRQIIVILRRQ